MSDASAPFANLVPGFDFLQGLMKSAGAAIPSMNQWIAPTLNPEELEKRIGELRTVQFWLEQNARMLGATIQALEVQRMTLATLKTMNVSMGELRKSMQMPMPADLHAAEPAAEPTRPPAAEPAAPVVDPVQWWGALTRQFTELAASALKDSGTEAAKTRAGTAAGQSVEGAVQMPKPAVAKAAAKAAPRRRRA